MEKEKRIKKNNHILNELEIEQLREKRREIITNAVFVSAGAIDLALLKLLSDTVGTDDMTAADLVFLFLGGSSSYLGSILMGINAIDYMDIKKGTYKRVKSKNTVNGFNKQS